uniref:cysteine protease ATG4C isoform X1 n=2 Tax=Callithrix jacchus TaxID=9483 RepID=UPI00159DF753|nr:cysteine protease ATG4C isoform X1 [Callithrix jacchus]XP_054092325.1 cysteine protease ATG4C isoform X1 [Callithrix jacchus]XP_054092326.1 cysteine protease ATG4C isoform X1 [Callithrix jacchus]XP_054092327.1 cysteine protease ATG4C isoform X1 [Callithrix jacchus]XP_054092328.1 cysteine protease ATG4C isoform X1 [Callithrix jacchus]XP_054092329.1 cysteine protease ATG4C isoform X1 [Callithrix jacchus]XP_054092330.1 cysteine protease ATG4C isoform X1 [Callithrix jacchus]XP_054092331.1 cys
MEATGTDEVDKLKTKFISAWNNMKYSWVLKTKTYFSRNSPVLLLGKCYHFKYEDEDKMLPATSGCTIEDHVIAGNVEEFRKDFISRIWLTYREEFPQIEGSALTTDCGWGCTLRTGQMLLAQGLILHFLGRAWTWPDALNIENSDSESWTSHTVKKFTASFEASLSGERELKTPTISLKETIGKYSDDHEIRNEIYHRKVISWFGDSPLAPFGLHQLIEYGKKSGKKAGDWYGPAVVAHILRKAVEEARHPDLQGITIYVAQDCTVYNSDVIDKQSASMTSDNADDKAVIILVPVRLGGERTNTDYLEFVKGILSLEYCVGIIGGKPKQSYYFAGFQDDSLIYMDPHYCQSFVDVSIKDFPLETFHCPSPKKMSFRKMDPSCTIGFYCRNVQDFKRASEEITKLSFCVHELRKGHVSTQPSESQKESPHQKLTCQSLVLGLSVSRTDFCTAEIITEATVAGGLAIQGFLTRSRECCCHSKSPGAAELLRRLTSSNNTHAQNREMCVFRRGRDKPFV